MAAREEVAVRRAAGWRAQGAPCHAPAAAGNTLRAHLARLLPPRVELTLRLLPGEPPGGGGRRGEAGGEAARRPWARRAAGVELTLRRCVACQGEEGRPPGQEGRPGACSAPPALYRASLTGPCLASPTALDAIPHGPGSPSSESPSRSPFPHLPAWTSRPAPPPPPSPPAQPPAARPRCCCWAAPRTTCCCATSG